MRILTLHPVIKTKKYGFESTQLYRAKIARHLGYDYLHLATNPQINPDWKRNLLNLGFANHEIICIPHSYSDIGHAPLSVHPSTLELAEGDTLQLTAEGFVSTRTLGDGSGRYYYTKGPFLFENFQTGELQWFHENGELALEARYVNPFQEPTPVEVYYPTYIYRKKDHIYSTEDLIVEFLSHHSKNTDLIIRDQYWYPMPKLWRFMENTGKNYYEYIHQNILLQLDKANLRKKTKYLVASETLALALCQIGYDASFLPPLFTTPVATPKEIGPILSYCVVGHMGEIKRAELVIETFIELYKQGSKAQVTFYGGSPERLKELQEQYDLPPTIHFKGIVDEIPYQLHQCYISASKTELFANACVEAMNCGLLALLSDVDIAHRYYAKFSNGIRLFKTKEDLLHSITEMEKLEFHQSNQENLRLASKYSLDNLALSYQKLLNNCL